MNEETMIGVGRDLNSGMLPSYNKHMDSTLGMITIMAPTIEDHYVTMNSASNN
jgi:hypothetical protein